MAGKVSQDVIEAVVRKNPNVRVSTVALEVVRASVGVNRGQVDQLVVEVVRNVTKLTVISQVVAEVARWGTAAARIDQALLEVARAVTGQTIVSQVVLEVAHSLGGGATTRRRVFGGFVG